MLALKKWQFMPNSLKLRKILEAMHKLGFKQIRQKGSHAFFEHSDGRTTVIPLHDEIKIRLLTKIVKKDLKLEMSEFLKIIQ